MPGSSSTSFRRLRGGAIALIVVALAGCAWAQPQFDAGQTSNNVFESTIGAGNVAQLQRSWSVPARAGRGYGDLIVGGGRVYAPSYGAVDAFDATTGTLRWSAPARPAQSGGSQFGVVTAFAPDLGANGLVFASQANVGSPFDPRSTGWTTALDASNGQVVWSQPLGWSGAVLVNGVLFAVVNRHVGDAGDFSGTVAFDARTGVERFRLPAFSAQAAGNGAVFGLYGADIGAAPVTGCATSSCIPTWIADYGGGFWNGKVAVADGWLYLAGTGGLEVFSASGCGATTCAATWKAAGSFGEIAVTKDRVFVNSDLLHGGSDVLHVFAAGGCGATTCSQLWSSAVARDYWRPTVANGLVYLSSRGSPTEAWPVVGCGAPTCAPVWSTMDALVEPDTALVINGRLLVGGFGIQTYALPPT